MTTSSASSSEPVLVLCIPTLSPAGAARAAALIDRASLGTCKPDQVFVVDNGGHFLEVTSPQWRDAMDVGTFTPGFNLGVGPAWNEALRRFSHATVVFANDDITLAPDSIERLIAPLKVHASSMACTLGHHFSFFAMTQEHVRRVGYFDEGFAPAYYEDTDYLRRMKLAGFIYVTVETGATHQEQSTSKDMGWDAQLLIDKQAVRYVAKWGGFEGQETLAHPWGIDMEVCVPSCNTTNLQRLIDSLAWQTVRPSAVTIASNADIEIDTRGLRVRQVKFWSGTYAIGDGDVSLRRNVATWAAQAPYIVYSDDDQVWPQNALEWFARRFTTDHLVVGHHRFVENIEARWRSLRNAKAESGVSRERHPNQEHWWQSCWGGCIGIHAMMIKYGVGGWDMGYPAAEDQQLARRIVGMGDDSHIRVHEPPWAWHEKDAIHNAPWVEPHRNACAKGEHVMVPDGEVSRCSECPVVRRSDDKTWPTVQLYDPANVRTETLWL
jgi:hypothetical protein